MTTTLDAAERTVVAVVPTRGSETLRRCLDSLAADLTAAGATASIVVVDDATPVPLELPPVIGGLDVTVKRLPHRRGFGPAVNAGVALSRSRWVAVVNDDVTVEPGCFAKLLAALAAGAAWVACPAVEAHERWAHQPHRVAVVDESLYQLVWDRATLRTLPIAFGHTLAPHYPSGALALYDRGCWEVLGGYDERFAPYYWEDVDLGLRAEDERLRGEARFRALHVPGARAIHARHRTVMRESRWLRKTIYRRNRELILHRHLLGRERRRWHLLALVGRATRGLLRGDASHLLGACWAWWRGRAEWRRGAQPTGALDSILDGPPAPRDGS